jgi:hypothetical protein
MEVVIDGGALIDWLRNQNYGVPMLQAAPDRIDGLAAGQPEAIEVIALDRVSRAPPPDPGVPALGYGLAFGIGHFVSPVPLRPGCDRLVPRRSERRGCPVPSFTHESRHVQRVW